MGKNTLKWEKIDEKFVTGRTGKAGDIKLFSITWDSFVPQDSNKYKLTCFLPGIRNNLGHFESVGTAQARAQQALEYWVKKTGLGGE